MCRCADTLRTVNPLFARLGIPTDAETLTGIQRLIKERVTETRHLDFKRQLNNIDDLADDMSALANVGGGVLIIGIGIDKADCAASSQSMIFAWSSSRPCRRHEMG